MSRPRLVVWAGLGAVLAALLTVVSGLAVGAVPRSWQWAHDWVLLSGITAGLVLAAVAVAVVQARSPGGGERPGGPLVRVGTIRARTVHIAAAGASCPRPGQLAGDSDSCGATAGSGDGPVRAGGVPAGAARSPAVRSGRGRGFIRNNVQ